MAIQKQRQFGFMRIINCWYFEHINMRHNFSQKTFEKLEECLFYLHVNKNASFHLYPFVACVPSLCESTPISRNVMSVS